MKEELKGMWFSVVIIDNEEGLRDKLFEIERELFGEKKITFDTGYGMPHDGNPGYRDWELDWSLRGGTSEEILDILDKAGIEYSIRNLRAPDEETLKRIAEWREEE